MNASGHIVTDNKLNTLFVDLGTVIMTFLQQKIWIPVESVKIQKLSKRLHDGHLGGLWKTGEGVQCKIRESWHVCRWDIGSQSQSKSL